MAEHHTATIDIEASAEELFAIVTDLESYPDWVENIKEIEILEVTDDGFPARASMTVDAMIQVVSYTLAYEYDYPNVVAWTSEPGGDLKQIDGSYRFDTDEEDGTTSVTYDMTLDPGFPVPGFMVRKAQRMIMGTALDGLKAQAEGG